VEVKICVHFYTKEPNLEGARKPVWTGDSLGKYGNGMMTIILGKGLVEHLPSKCEVLSSNPSAARK
jgi:hypothetical protein